MGWQLKTLNLGQCYVPSDIVRATRKLETDQTGRGWKSEEGQGFYSSELEFKNQSINTLEFLNSVEIAKFWRATYHVDDINHDCYYIAIACDDFYFQLKGEEEVLLKKGYAYLFNQRRVHRAHNNGKPFVCAVAAVYKHQLKQIKKALKITGSLPR